jgi:hypothetical protein
MGEPTGCIFCGNSPQTKTHIFRKAWIDRLMVPAPGPYEMVHGTGDLTGASRETEWETDRFDMAPGAACDPCNSGWMHQIDRAAEQIIEPMVLGHKATIRLYNDQKAVARWITQVAILMDQTQIQQVVPPEVPQQFYADREPVAGMTIWLARTQLEWTVQGWQRAWILSPALDSVPPSRPNMGLFTFRVINLVVQALIPLHNDRGLIFRFNRGDNMRFLKQLWPSRHMPVSWPPSVTIGQNTLEDFARSFEPEGGLSPGEAWTP